MCWIKAQFGPKKVLSLLSTVRVCILIPQSLLRVQQTMK